MAGVEDGAGGVVLGGIAVAVGLLWIWVFVGVFVGLFEGVEDAVEVAETVGVGEISATFPVDVLLGVGPSVGGLGCRGVALGVLRVGPGLAVAVTVGGDPPGVLVGLSGPHAMAREAARIATPRPLIACPIRTSD